MFGDPSGLAPEPIQEGGGTGDVLLGSNLLSQLQGQYASSTSPFMDGYWVTYPIFKVRITTQSSLEANKCTCHPLQCEHDDITTRTPYIAGYEHSYVSTGAGGPSLAFGQGGSKSGGNGNNNGKVKHTLADVKSMYDLSAVQNSSYVDKFNNSLEQMYNLNPNFFDGLWDGGNTSPVKVFVTPAKAIANLNQDMINKANNMGVTAIGAAAGFDKNTNKPVMFIGEEYFTGNFNNIKDAKTKDYLTTYEDIDGYFYDYMMYDIIAHETTHIMDELALGSTKFNALTGDEREALAVEGENSLRALAGRPLKKNSFLPTEQKPTSTLRKYLEIVGGTAMVGLLIWLGISM